MGSACSMTEEGDIRLVSDRADDRDCGVSHRPDNIGVVEDEEVFETSAAAGNDNHIDFSLQGFDC